MKKYKIDYQLNILTYNIYFKSMLGLDKNFLPQNEAHNNVKKTIKDNSTGKYIIGLQEVQCLEKILPNNISKSNFVTGKSGKETLVTIWSNNFKVIKSKTYEFREGRPIQITLLFDKVYYLIVNIHAPHDDQNFGIYLGNLSINNDEYSNELIRLLEEKINLFLKGLDIIINRLIILGDFNEIFRNSNRYQFLIDTKNKLFNMTTDKNKIKSCCVHKNFSVPCDYIFDSYGPVYMIIANKNQPASDHLPIRTNLKYTISVK